MNETLEVGAYFQLGAKPHSFCASVLMSTGPECLK